MALDPLLFKPSRPRISAPATQVRIAESDYTEAKANIIVERILDSAPKMVDLESMAEIDEAVPEIQEAEAQAGIVPTEEKSGLRPTFPLDESQQAAINSMMGLQYSAMIGAAGSGKTTTLKAYLHQCIYGDAELGVEPMKVKKLEGRQYLNIALCAFTGIATQVIKANMPEWLHPACKTIHSLLEYSPVETKITTKEGGQKETVIFMPTRHGGNKFDYDLIIIDEASMVGLDLWHQILDAAKLYTKIILVGDLNQLPPVMSQSMFAYVLSAWPVFELTHIHRQTEEAANKIIDVAHAVLAGKDWTYDDSTKNPNWRVIGVELDASPRKAGAQIVNICNELRKMRVHPEADPLTPYIYDPNKDRIITAGNGYNEEDPNSAVQQYIINDALSQLLQPSTEELPRIIIDAGLSKKKFAINYRVMATKNESPDVVNRVTNGMTGIIRSIDKNIDWHGNHALVGPEHEVMVNRKDAIDDFFNVKEKSLAEQVAEANFELDVESFLADSKGINTDDKKEKVGGGFASHSVTIEFANGATRVFSSKAAVDSLQLAYASTCHKCQGSQMDTAIIVVHHVAKSQLSREWLYTGITRAVRRVIFLYTKHGIRMAQAKQRIFGRTLEEKIKRYKDLQEEEVGVAKTKVRLYI